MLNNPDKTLFTVRKYQYINTYKIGFNLSSINTKVISYTSIHLARHSFACLALANGVSMEVIAKMLGHSDVRTTKIYAKVIDKSITEQIGTLSSKFGSQK